MATVWTNALVAEKVSSLVSAMNTKDVLDPRDWIIQQAALDGELAAAWKAAGMPIAELNKAVESAMEAAFGILGKSSSNTKIVAGLKPFLEKGPRKAFAEAYASVPRFKEAIDGGLPIRLWALAMKAKPELLTQVGVNGGVWTLDPDPEKQAAAAVRQANKRAADKAAKEAADKAAAEAAEKAKKQTEEMAAAIKRKAAEEADALTKAAAAAKKAGDSEQAQRLAELSKLRETLEADKARFKAEAEKAAQETINKERETLAAKIKAALAAETAKLQRVASDSEAAAKKAIEEAARSRAEAEAAKGALAAARVEADKLEGEAKERNHRAARVSGSAEKKEKYVVGNNLEEAAMNWLSHHKINDSASFVAALNKSSDEAAELALTALSFGVLVKSKVKNLTDQESIGKILKAFNEKALLH